MGPYSIYMNDTKNDLHGLVQLMQANTMTKPVCEDRLAALVAKRINDWLYDEQLDHLHDICHEVVTSEHPDLDPDDLWDLLPEVFASLRPFTVS